MGSGHARVPSPLPALLQTGERRLRLQPPHRLRTSRRRDPPGRGCNTATTPLHTREPDARSAAKISQHGAPQHDRWTLPARTLPRHAPDRLLCRTRSARDLDRILWLGHPAFGTETLRPDARRPPSHPRQGRRPPALAVQRNLLAARVYRPSRQRFLYYHRYRRRERDRNRIARHRSASHQCRLHTWPASYPCRRCSASRRNSSAGRCSP